MREADGTITSIIPITRKMVEDDAYRKYMSKNFRAWLKHFYDETYKEIMKKHTTKNKNKQTKANPENTTSSLSLGDMARSVPQQSLSRDVSIPKQLLRRIVESHYSDGSVSKEDITYTPETTHKVYF